MGKKKNAKKKLLKQIRCGLRLDTKAPKVETPKTVYNRKAKHKKKYYDKDVFLNASSFSNRNDYGFLFDLAA